MGSTRRGVHCFSGRAVEQTYVGHYQQGHTINRGADSDTDFVFGCTTPAYSRIADQVYCMSCLLSSCGFSRRMACQRFPIFQVPIAFSSIALIVMSLRMSTCAASAWHGSFG